MTGETTVSACAEIFGFANKLHTQVLQNKSVDDEDVQKAINLIRELALALNEANGALRTAHEIAARVGVRTNFDGWRISLSTLLAKQHRMMYPKQYER